jgi:threonine/homoserine/homoserine lactone efflux protein
MPSSDHLIAFAVAAFVLIVIPGPSVLFTVSRALAYGRKAALTTVLGGAAGLTMVGLGVGLAVKGRKD